MDTPSTQSGPGSLSRTHPIPWDFLLTHALRYSLQFSPRYAEAAATQGLYSNVTSAKGAAVFVVVQSLSRV